MKRQQQDNVGRTTPDAHNSNTSGKHSTARAALLAFGAVVVIGAVSFGIARYTVESARPAPGQLPALAEQAETGGNTLLAIALRKQYLEKFPSDATARIFYAAALARGGQFNEADAEIERLGKQPETGVLLLGEANKFYDKPDFPVAAFLYRRYLTGFDSTNVPARIDCGYALFRSGLREEGKSMTMSALDHSPKQPLALFNLGVMAAEEEDMTLAAERFEECAEAAQEHYPEIAAKARQILGRIKQLSDN